MRLSLPTQAVEEEGNEAVGSSLPFTLSPDNWSPFQEQVGPEAVIGRGWGRASPPGKERC